MNESEQPEFQMRKSKILKQKSSLKSIKEQDKTFSKLSNDTLSKIYSDNNELEQNEEILEEFHEKKFEVFYLNLIELYQKAQYKKLIKSINQKKKTFSTSRNFWKINHLKIVSIIKILERKLLKYHNEPNISNIANSFKYLENEIISWINSLEDTLKDLDFMDDLSNLNNGPKELYFEEKIELLITFVLAQCYLYARFCIHQQMLTDCIGFLALGEKLIRTTSFFFISPESAHYSILIYTFLSSLFITDENYETAKNYINAVLKIAYKEFEVRLKGDPRFLVNFDDYNKLEKENLYEIIFSITIAFYHLGVCYEKECELEKSYQAYKQARWFGQQCKLNKVRAFTDMLFDLEHRAQIRFELVDFFRREEANISLTPVKEKKKPKAIYDEEEKERRYEKIEAFISKLPLTEIDDEDVDLLNKVKGKPLSKNINYITKSVHVLNYLMSDKFKNVIDKMKKIEINCLDKETKRTIQKRILFLKNTERMKNIKKMKDKQEIDKSFNNLLYSDDREELVTKTYNEDKKYVNKRKNLRSLPNQVKSYNTERSKLIRPSLTNETYLQTAPTSITQTSPMQTIQDQQHCPIKRPIKLHKNNKVIKINHGKYIFNPNFREKVNFLNMQFNKELKFQRNILKTKEGKSEISFKPYNEKKVIHECENFFNKTLETQMREVIKRERLLEKAELNKKALSVSKKMKQTFTSRFVRETNALPKPKVIEYTIDVSNRFNETYLNTLQEDLNNIQEKEIIYNKALKQLKTKGAIK